MKKESATSKHSGNLRKLAVKTSATPPHPPHPPLHPRPFENMYDQATKEIIEINGRYERLTDNADEAIFRVEADGGKVLNINPAAERIFGYSMKEWQSDPSLSFKTIHPDYKEKQKQIIGELNTTKKTIKNAVLGWIAKDGHQVIMEYTVIPIINKDSKIIYFESIGRDITKRKQAEEELDKHRQHLEVLVKERTAELTKTNDQLKHEITERKQAETKLQEETKSRRVLLDNMPCIALLLKPKTREIVASNDEAAKVGAVPGKQCFATWGQSSSPCPWCLAPKVWATGETKHIEIEGVGKVWDAHWISITEDLYLHYAFDITEQKQIQREIQLLNTNLEKRVQEELEKSRRKDYIMIQQSRLATMGEMIMYITHQWGQPLWGLQLLFHNLQDIMNETGKKSEEFDRLIVDGQKLVKRMFTTIDDFKSFFQANKQKEHFSINKSIKDALSLVDSNLKYNNISVSIKENEELLALGFPNEYSQVILNILNNAKDAINAKGIKGDIKIELLQEKDSTIASIRNNGGGIPENIIDKVFDTYFTTKKEGKGTGIGLYMSKVIIEEHMNGRINVQNTSDGAEFNITTPIIPQ